MESMEPTEPSDESIHPRKVIIHKIPLEDVLYDPSKRYVSQYGPDQNVENVYVRDQVGPRSLLHEVVSSGPMMLLNRSSLALSDSEVIEVELSDDSPVVAQFSDVASTLILMAAESSDDDHIVSQPLNIPPTVIPMTPESSDDDLVVSEFPNVSPTVIRNLLSPLATVADIALLTVGKTADISTLSAVTSPVFTSSHHMLQCLTIYHSVLTFKMELAGKPHTRTHTRGFNAFVSGALDRLGSGESFVAVSRWVGMHLEVSLRDVGYDFSWDDTALEQGGVELVLEGVTSLSRLREVIGREDVVAAVSGPAVVGKTLARIVIGFCVASEDVWNDLELWGVLGVVGGLGVEAVSEGVVFGVEEEEGGVGEAKGVLHVLASTPCAVSEIEYLDRVNSVLDSLVVSERVKSRIVGQDSPPFLLTALRCGSRPMVLYLTRELNVDVSRVDPVTGVDCPWALLETARTGSWEMVQQIWRDGDMVRVFRREDGNGGEEFLKQLGDMWITRREGLDACPPWGVKVDSVGVLAASLGNGEVFEELLDGAGVSGLVGVGACVEVEWVRGSGRVERFHELGPLDLALLGGFLGETKMMLELLVADAESDATSPSRDLYNPTILLQFLLWMIKCHKEPPPPSLYPSATILPAVAPSFTLVQQLLTLLSDTGLDLLISHTPWPTTLPYDLYARDWISSTQTKTFLDSDRFSPTYPRRFSSSSNGPEETPFLCCAAARFDVELIAQYLPSVSTNAGVLLTKTRDGDTWVHLLAKGFMEVSKDRGFMHMVLSFVGVPSVFSAVDSRGRSVKECWEE
ncbi:hypothetical protein HDU98_010027, partial [Podochytrium sp. JEL0797]